VNSERIYASFNGGATASLPELVCAMLDRQKIAWPQLQAGYAALDAIQVRRIEEGNDSVILQCNPQRIKSAEADIDPVSIKTRSCFLCQENLPDVQQAIVYRRKYMVLCNPFPIFPLHFTIAHIEHTPQALSRALPSFLQLAKDFHPDLALLYNGPESGASAPDHLHFQAVPKAAIPALNDGAAGRKRVLKQGSVSLFRTITGERPAMIVEGKDKRELIAFIRRIIGAMKRFVSSPNEPMMNLFCRYEGGRWQVMIFPRKKHRPDAYYKSGAERILVSPGAVDMGGLLVLPRIEDFHRLDAASLRDIFREVSLSEESIEKIAAAI
jgi:diadenosine tetraphosphate (Ap4A) HIT family hydrolase